jgi:hypothetical protein
MDQDETVNKVLRDIKSTFKLTKGAIGVLRIHLSYIYAAGFDAGINFEKEKHLPNKEVYQCNRDGHIIKSFPSATKAAKQLHIDRTTIYLAIAEKRLTRKGYYWKYKEDFK